MVLGWLVVVPLGLLAKMSGAGEPRTMAVPDTHAAGARARAAVMRVERRLSTRTSRAT